MPIRPSQFELMCDKLGLKTETEQIGSNRLRAWVSRRSVRNRRYVPEFLLNAWGLDVRDEILSPLRG